MNINETYTRTKPPVVLGSVYRLHFECWKRRFRSESRQLFARRIGLQLRALLRHVQGPGDDALRTHVLHGLSGTQFWLQFPLSSVFHGITTRKYIVSDNHCIIFIFFFEHPSAAIVCITNVPVSVPAPATNDFEKFASYCFQTVTRLWEDGVGCYIIFAVSNKTLSSHKHWFAASEISPYLLFFVGGKKWNKCNDHLVMKVMLKIGKM